MMKKSNIKNFSIRFRRWSRKQYAVFCSLGKQISIGCLRRGIADQSLRKNELILNTGLNVITYTVTADDSDLWSSENTDLTKTISDCMLLKIVLSECSSNSACPYNCNTLNTNTIYGVAWH